ncbi:MAG: 30S ribosomal protein S7 [Desulfobulbaceae bacterium]|nr:MAG: 30S ribosomal protein S7 [Desulfobulbaceae bacterium]
MPRRRIAPRRPVDADPRFNSVVVSKFVSRIMYDGKKSIARTIFYDAMDMLATKVKDVSPIEVFEGALDKVRPRVEVKSRRVGGATYHVPIEVRTERRNALAFRWLISYARQRPGKTMAEKLAAELSDAFQNRGAAVKKKEDTHRMADANKAFAHYRW